MNDAGSQAMETLYLSSIPGATPSKWVKRFNSNQRGQQALLVNQDEISQTLFLEPAAEGEPARGLPQLGYLRWERDSSWQELVAAQGIDPEQLHLVKLYEEEPVVCVSKDHLLAAWNPETDGPLPDTELDPQGFMNPRDFDGPAVTDPLEEPEEVAAGERMAITIVETGAGYTILPASVARMFGTKNIVVHPTNAHPGWAVGLAWLREKDSELIQSFIAVTKGRRPNSSRS